jgi:hypothetical protein
MVQGKQRSFAAGEISEQFWNHDEYRIHQTGLARCRNMVVRPGGGLTRRPPTEFITTAYVNSVLIPMNIAAGDTFLIEVGDLKARFYRNNALLLDGAAAYEIAHPYTASQLKRLRWQRSGDVLFLTHPNGGMWQLTRRGNIDWLSEAFVFKVRPFADENVAKSKTIRASGTSGTVTLTAAGFTFANNEVGQQYRFRDGDQRKWAQWEPAANFSFGDCSLYNGNLYRCVRAGGPYDTGTQPPVHTEGVRMSHDVQWEFVRGVYGIAEITAVAPGGATATATVITDLPEEFAATYDTEYGGAGQAKSWRWARQALFKADGWPTNIAIHQQRLYLIRGPRFWASAPGDYLDFTQKAAPDGSLAELIGSTSGQAEDILWLSSGKVALIGTGGQEYALSAASTSDGISPTNLKIVPATTDGSVPQEPVRAKGSVLHLGADGRSLFETLYNFQIDDFDSEDRALPAQHLLAGSADKLCFQKNPLRIVWMLDKKGRLIGFTYNPKQEIFGWHRADMDGTKVLDIAVTGPEDDGTDTLWLKVERSICGKPRIFIERLLPYFNPDGPADLDTLLYVDCQRRAEGEHMTTISGFAHLAGASVRAVTNNGDAGLLEVDVNGTVCLPGDGNCWAVIGLPYRSHIRLLNYLPQADDGSTMGRAKKVNHLVIRGIGGPGALAGDIGKDHDYAEAIFPPFVSGDALTMRDPHETVLVNGDWDVEGMVDLWTDGPFVFDISALDRAADLGV